GRDPDSASELRRLADENGHKLKVKGLDVTNPLSIETAAAELDGQSIDLLINNAGVMGARGQTIGNIDYDAWAKVLDANTMGLIRVLRHLLTMWHAAQAHRDHYQRHGVNCRQYFWRLDRLSQFEGRGEHGHARSGDRSCLGNLSGHVGQRKAQSLKFT